MGPPLAGCPISRLMGWALFIGCWSPNTSPAEAIFSTITASATVNAYVYLGELSVTQLVLFFAAFLKIVVLTVTGVFPIRMDLQKAFEKGKNFVAGWLPPECPPEDIGSPLGYPATRDARDASFTMAELSTYFLDCPLQFVCDVDTWASRDHEYFAERLIASWFRNPNHTWQHENAGIYAGRGTCREMYPCPFDVQEVVGIRIPGSQRIAAGSNEVNVDDSYSFF